MKIVQRYETERFMHIFHYKTDSVEEIDYHDRTIEMRPTLFERVKAWVMFPISFFQRRRKISHYIEAIRILLYLIQRKAYLTQSLFMHVKECDKAMNEYRQTGQITLAAYTEKELIGYVKRLISVEIDGLIAKASIQELAQGPKRQDLFKLIKKMMTTSNTYKSYIIYLLFKLMINIYREKKTNQIDDVTISLFFVPLFLGSSRTFAAKKKGAAHYTKILQGWISIMTYIPRARLSK
ncbi:hypothetical protein NEDG_01949 [Nematocida displodere]|uniref:Rho-GAP domain-containing protein n=1 Tax=Nematocida displodere TaxID=1805483 RepID=A0A177EJW3_9MICR|nr:hypothetical protein NEDG_01949 [Nematocida displodere]